MDTLCRIATTNIISPLWSGPEKLQLIWFWLRFWSFFFILCAIASFIGEGAQETLLL
jgi:hypothetical protein